ncbi:Pimeloyl-ACP methyl ester carboxylesterase [Micromonospora phaseoli]|uniref:Pimeloyl-ACP methyl ester carboxylesterase n=1 Tax=Micromonospora phaseoli TaxID=1144548 RepID=A0A1H6X906_9ACTN|nr:alpha/beta hydrolase [Micromonospora phaseoli]PZW02152.1 pimeloyl-ACP methyl ester carboxylesterase [Micromonospora phaseoli]GIJ75847.1 hydrolase [Micromonospora phaseoli]SEJ25643.1 Pimeloyl-ACP methyl ester carboxylesterase [Micromonospora phaseoli]
MKPAILRPDHLLPAHSVPPPWPGRTVRLDGATTYVRDTPATGPDAEPALYVHGLGGSSQNWTDLAGLLTDRLDGQAIDLPGFGRSEPGRRYTVPVFAERVIRWIEYSDRGPVHLFGNSLGGAISVRVAAVRPDLVRTLTLVSPALPFLDFRRSLQGRMLPLLAIPRGERLAAWRLAQVAPEVMAQQVMEACVADLSRICDQRRQEALEEIRIRYQAEHYAAAYVRTFRGLVSTFLRSYLPGSGSLWRLARTVSAPTLVIGGRQDRLIDVRVAPQTARVIPDSRLLMLDDVGHVAQLEVPRLVARAVLGLLTEMGDSARRADLAG